MGTVTITPSVTTEQTMAALREQHGEHKVKLSTKQADTIMVTGNSFARSRVHVQQTGGGTSLNVRPAPIGPIGYVVSALWFTPKVTRSLEEAPQLRAGA